MGIERPGPCKFGSTYYEDVAGDGGSRMLMFDCNYEGDIDISEDCEDCPACEPIPKVKCPKHGVEHYEGGTCGSCMAEAYEEDRRLGEQYQQLKDGDGKS